MISARGRGGRSTFDIIGTGMLVGKIKIKPQGDHSESVGVCFLTNRYFFMQNPSKRE